LLASSGNDVVTISPEEVIVEWSSIGPSTSMAMWQNQARSLTGQE